MFLRRAVVMLRKDMETFRCLNIAAPSVIQAAGHPPKRIEEYAGRVNSAHANVSVARMQSPSGG